MIITARTALYAVLGDPVSHSRSPALHNAWLKAAGRDAIYLALPIAEAGADAAFAALSAYGLKGANVTVPHKARAARVAARRDAGVEALAAANVLTWEEGSLSAYNTDAPGLLAALDEGAPGWRAKARSALVLGAGGAGRAAAWALAGAGCSVTIANRTLERAEAAASLAPGMRVAPWARLEAAFAAADLIVNTTTLGMAGAPDFDWPLAAAPAHAIVMDAVYAPLETALLRAARARGLAAVDGVGMLLHQAALSYEIWFGERPDLALGRAALEGGV